MPGTELIPYAVAVAAAVLCGLAARVARVPAPAVALAVGLLAGRAGLEILPADAVTGTLPGVTLHLAIILGVLGYRLGQGMLRLPFLEVFRRSLPPLGLAVLALALDAWFLSRFLPPAEPERSFLRFILPLSFVFAVFPLLALRDLRGRPPADVGSLFLVAIVMVGAVHSFTPQILWSRAGPSEIWRGPVLLLGESGACGVAAAALFLIATRQLRLPRWAVAPVLLLAGTYATVRLSLWPPFAALGFGIMLGRTGEREWTVPHRALFSEVPFVLIAAASFAPDLFRQGVAGPALAHAAALAALLLVVRARTPGGRDLVTGPGLLFLGLTLSVRLDGRMSPLTRHAVDFALPAWVVLRLLTAWLSRKVRSAPTSTPHNG